MNPRPTIVYNPIAGKGFAGQHLTQVQQFLAERKFDCDLQLTEGQGHAHRLAKQAAESGSPLVIAAGGDGTVNEVINGLMTAEMDGRKRPAMGVLPVGRGNDFHFGMKNPADWKEAADILIEGKQRPVDVGLVIGGDFPEGRYFGNGLGLGFDTVVGFEAAKMKRLQGAASYLVAVVKTIFLYAKAPVYELTLDDGASIEEPFLMLSVMNGQRMGGAFYTAPEGNPHDGIFDLCLTGQVPQAAMLPLAAKFLKGRQLEHPAVRMAQARKVSIRAVKGTIPAHADGETICTAGQALTVELLPGALDVVMRAA